MKNAIHIRRVLATAIMLLAGFISKAQSQDTTVTNESQFCIVTLTNGTKVSGMLQSQDNAQVVVIDPILGQLTVLQSNIELLQVVETGKSYTFTMSSGKKYMGKVIAQSASSITIDAANLGEIKLTTTNIAGFNSGAEVSSELTYDHGSRYLFAPSAIPLRKGEGYYQNMMILMNGFRYGVTDHVSVGAGIIVPVGFYADVKYGHQVGKNVHVAAGGMLITTMMGFGAGVVCGFGSITLGDRWTNATFTAGYGAVMADGDWNATKRPILNFSAMARVTDGFSLITENYFFPVRSYEYTNGNFSNPRITHHYRPQLSAGFRIGGGKHTFDIAGTTLGDVTEGDLFVIPYFSYAYHFNRNKK